ncbi:MAG: metallophosphoesterase [Desulfobaccales bacterium]
MPDIRYVCLSDTHFGAATSLLTNLKAASDEIDGLIPSPVLVNLVEGLRFLIEQNKDQSQKPTLVLNGDILELALADDHDAAMTFERFIDLIMDDHRGKMFDQIYYLPGNHDHHLWETARESQYVDYISSQKPWGSVLESPWHTTRMFSDPTRAYFLTALVRRRPNLHGMTIQTAYPNYGLLSADRKRCVVFHHGHFVESIYHLMSTLKTMFFPDSRIPSEIWNLEAENFAWIDFFWSTLGRSSAVGQGVSRIYEKLQNEAQFKQLLDNLADGLVKQYGSNWAGGLEAKLLSWAFNAIYSRLGALERNQPGQVLSQDAEQGLYGYMDGLPNQTDSQGNHIGPLTHQMADENLEARGLDQFTFVFGHTHKPFQDLRNFRSFPGWVKVYNSGGWVVDTVERQPYHGGAVILIDENLESTSLRMYNESDDPGHYEVTVEEACHPGDTPGVFHHRIWGLVNSSTSPWQAFSNEVARDISIRAQNLKTRIYSPI